MLLHQAEVVSPTLVRGVQEGEWGDSSGAAEAGRGGETIVGGVEGGGENGFVGG